MSLQDAERGDSWPLAKDKDVAYDWSELTKGGRNGFFLLLLALSWWYKLLRTDNEKASFKEAVVDTTWVLDQVVRGLRTGSISTKKRKEIEDGNGGNNDIVDAPAKKRLVVSNLHPTSWLTSALGLASRVVVDVNISIIQVNGTQFSSQ